MNNARILFPQKSDYPESLAILDNPHKDVNLYMRLVVSSASAYFETDPFTRYLFKKRFLWVEDYMKSTSGGRFEKAIDIITSKQKDSLNPVLEKVKKTICEEVFSVKKYQDSEIDTDISKKAEVILEKYSDVKLGNL